MTVFLAGLPSVKMSMMDGEGAKKKEISYGVVKPDGELCRDGISLTGKSYTHRSSSQFYMMQACCALVTLNHPLFSL